MGKAITLQQVGNEQVLKIENVEVGKPKQGEVLVKNIAIGINKDDIYTKLSTDSSPVIPGYSASGEIVEIGANVSGFSPGNLVVYLARNMGCYQELCIVNQNDLIAIPEEINHKTIAAAYFAGMMAHALVKRVYLVRSEIILLIHDAASDIGHILTQWANILGATVIGSVDSDDKKDFALKHGCHDVVNFNYENWDKDIMKMTKNYGVNVVYDPLGKTTFDSSIKCLTKMGIMICYGAESQSIGAIDIRTLSEKSLYITCPSVFDYKSNKMELLLTADEIFNIINSGKIRISIDSEYNFNNIAEAHQKIKNNKTVGLMLLTPHIE